MAAKRLILIFSILILASCSWEYQRSHFKVPYYNPQPGEFYSLADEISDSSHGHCVRTIYYIKPKNWKHMSSCNCEAGWKVDSAFDKRGRVYLVSKHHLQRTETYLYDTSITRYFDRRGRAIRQDVHIHQPDTSYEYWQYFEEDGKPEAQKRPIIYQILEGE